MKKMFIVVIIALAAMICQIAPVGAAEWVADMEKPIQKEIPADVDVTDFIGGDISFVPIENGNKFQVTVYKARLTTTDNGGDFVPAKVRIASGILHAYKESGRDVSEYIAEGPVDDKNGNFTFRVNNYSVVPKVPVVEHNWGVGLSAGQTETLHLVLNPNSPWVCYEEVGGKPNLKKMAICSVMCPNGTAVPLKSLGKGKLKQGKHPELAYACSEGVESYPAVK